jgi:glycogen phosphorylase
MLLQTTSSVQSGFYEMLKELAMDLHWSWSHATDKVWRLLDPVLWELTHNPLVVLQTVSQQRISEVMEDVLVQEIIKELVEAKRQRALAPAWFQHHHPQTNLRCVAYFSMEFMLSEALPIYSGGLGNVAGDHLKTASDLGVPLVGVGLLFQQGYSRQVINPDGTQQYIAPFNDPGQLPVLPLRNAEGEWIRIEIKLPGYSVWLRTWQVQVGRTFLYLLDSNDAANFPVHRAITNELYGSGSELRFLQELVLGIGGWLLLEALDIHPEVCHLNEGHSAFLVVERALKFMDKNGCRFEEALLITRAGNIFTTHTAIGAGFDLFSPELVTLYLRDYINNRLKLSVNEFLALGRMNPNDEAEPLNTAYLAINGSSFVNGVSQLHHRVSQQLFAPLFPRWPLHEVPVGYITNGVHMPTWDSPEADKLWTEACGKERWLGTLEGIEQNILSTSIERIWAMVMEGKKEFITFIRNRYARQLATVGVPLEYIDKISKTIKPAVFTICFARRFVSYKRTNLLLKDRERLKRILSDKDRPVQLIIAGKAHRGDGEGQALIGEWISFIKTEGLEGKVIFLSDYDMLLCEHLVQGADLWINTPRRPWEACGTSGMKVLVNGGINLSVLDGWWDEAYKPSLGWGIGKHQNGQPAELQDQQDAAQLYDLLEREVIPEFYRRNAEGIPEEWVSRIRKSMAHLTPRFSANRCLREYTEKFYLPAADAFLKRAANGGVEGLALFRQARRMMENWKDVHFGNVTFNSTEKQHLVRAEVYLQNLPVTEARVELYADGRNGQAAEIHCMALENNVPGTPGFVVYKAVISAERPASDYTPRLLPCNENLVLPLECPVICWQR